MLYMCLLAYWREKQCIAYTKKVDLMLYQPSILSLLVSVRWWVDTFLVLA